MCYKKIAVAAIKGGVGKSTITANIGLPLRDYGLLEFGLPSVAMPPYLKRSLPYLF